MLKGIVSNENCAETIRELLEVMDSVSNPFYIGQVNIAIDIITHILDNSYPECGIDGCASTIRNLIEVKTDIPDELHDQVDTAIVIITQIIEDMAIEKRERKKK